MDDLSHRLRTFVERLVAEEQVSAVAVLVGSADRVEGEAYAGRVRSTAPVAPDRRTLFDLASLTKPFMASLALLLEGQDRWSLEQTIGDIWPQAPLPLAHRTLADLLRHRAGFQAWAPFYQLCSRPGEVEELLLGGRMLSGEPDLYSDLDYILWGLAAEISQGRPLADLTVNGLSPLLESGTLMVEPGPDSPVAECTLDSAREVELAAGLGIELEPLEPSGIWLENGCAPMSSPRKPSREL
jgi:CubicO group peptidase (beta-lactamase class C family)